MTTATDRQPTEELHEARTITASFFLFGAVFFNRLAPLYVAGSIARDFGIAGSARGTLALGIGFGWAAGMGLAWWSSGRWTDRRRVLVGAGVTAVVDALALLSGSWILFVVLRGVGGMFSASTSPAITSLTFRAAPGHRRGLATGIVQSSSRVGGSLVAPVVITAAGVAFGWRTGLLVGACTLAVATVAFALAVPVLHDPVHAAGRAHAKPVLRPGGRRNVVISALDCAALLGWLMIVSQGGVPFLRDWLDVSTVVAGRILAGFGIGAALGAFVMPMWSDRVGRRATLVVATGLGALAALTLAALATADVRTIGGAAFVLFVGGLAMGGLPLVISLIPAEAVERGDVGRALVGPVLSAEIVGGALVPAVAFALASDTELPAVLTAWGVVLLAAAAVSSALTGRRPRILARGPTRPAAES